MKRTVVVLALSSLPFFGCAKIMFGTQYQTAMTNKDYPALQKICLRQVVLTTGGEGNIARACDVALNIAVEKNDLPYIQQACEQGKHKKSCAVTENNQTFASLGSLGCSELPAQLDKIRLVDMPLSQQGDVVAKLASCDAGEYIFEKISHYGEQGPQGMGVSILKTADKRSNGALYTSFTNYVNENTGKNFLNDQHGEFAANHIGNWLVDNGYNDLCKPLTAAVKGSSEEVRVNILFYFSRTQCQEAIPIAAELLASSIPRNRVLACNNLATFGDKSVLKKVMTVAETDSFYEVQENNGYAVKVYPVAEACKQAYGKIQLRTE